MALVQDALKQLDALVPASPARDRRPVTGGPLGAGARIALGAPSLWPVGLAGFLARGGIVLFALPIVGASERRGADHVHRPELGHRRRRRTAARPADRAHDGGPRGVGRRRHPHRGGGGPGPRPGGRGERTGRRPCAPGAGSGPADAVRRAARQPGAIRPGRRDRRRATRSGRLPGARAAGRLVGAVRRPGPRWRARGRRAAHRRLARQRAHRRLRGPSRDARRPVRRARARRRDRLGRPPSAPLGRHARRDRGRRA